MSALNVKVGDRLILRRTDRRFDPTDREVEVTRIGRKWGYASEVEGFRGEVKFDLATGYEDSGQYSSHRRVLTAEMDADEKRRDAALSAMKGHELRFEYGGARKVSTEALERIVAILDEGVQP